VKRAVVQEAGRDCRSMRAVRSGESCAATAVRPGNRGACLWMPGGRRGDRRRLAAGWRGIVNRGPGAAACGAFRFVVGLAFGVAML